ncbi:MAG: cytochrome P460 family protein [Bryobacteraceae bacterium]|nr:cytochrome P460 family protein [Bryobacteraceae bacterium]MDW8380106.1 cytochrome P460 family protein [Bryobacterales bacterium]
MQRAAACLLLFAGVVCSEDKAMPRPQYTAAGELLRPESYREWMFVGANLGMAYTESQVKPKANYHTIYMQREAYDHYLRTGVFPNHTMLVMEILTAGTNVSINKQGSFADQRLGIEVAVKDEVRFPEKWAYFNFIGADGKQLDKAEALPKERCWRCHNQHGAVDNVFVQFHTVLKDAGKHSIPK